MGLLPCSAPVISLGNAAGAGAVNMLLSSECRAFAERISKAFRNIDLTAEGDFFDLYVDSMGFD
jgi:uncharacterized 2Fe-2S/4Fe-4S cluster protein (DUF4445 family)